MDRKQLDRLDLACAGTVPPTRPWDQLPRGKLPTLPPTSLLACRAFASLSPVLGSPCFLLLAFRQGGDGDAARVNDDDDDGGAAHHRNRLVDEERAGGGKQVQCWLCKGFMRAARFCTKASWGARAWRESFGGLLIGKVEFCFSEPTLGKVCTTARRAACAARPRVGALIIRLARESLMRPGQEDDNNNIPRSIFAQPYTTGPAIGHRYPVEPPDKRSTPSIPRRDESSHTWWRSICPHSDLMCILHAAERLCCKARLRAALLGRELRLSAALPLPSSHYSQPRQICGG